MKPRDVSRDHGRLLRTLADLRQRADYGYDPIDVDVAATRDRTLAFVGRVAELVQ